MLTFSVPIPDDDRKSTKFLFSPLFVVPQKFVMKASMFKLIFILIQLSEMHWAGRFNVIGVNNFLLVIS